MIFDSKMLGIIMHDVCARKNGNIYMNILIRKYWLFYLSS